MALDLAPFGRWTLRDKAAQRRHMYIAQAKSGKFEIVKNLGVMNPKECMQGTV